jgi:uncharacterized LabA/DUF88 family protein
MPAHSSDEPPLSVVVFIDWQNVYMGARDAFGFRERPQAVGNVDPLHLARFIAAAPDRTERPRELKEARVYRGQPKQQQDETSYRAYWAQRAAWEKRGGDRLTVASRDLRYPPGWKHGDRSERPQEKGVDVALAIDLVALAIRRGADRAVVVSTDTDLLPALELVAAECGEEFIEVAAWDNSPHRHAPMLRPKGVSISQRRLKQGHYERMKDEVNYSLPKERRTSSSLSWDDAINAEGRRRRPPR